jgi:tRNA A37 methylthiotransferase MiaB
MMVSADESRDRLQRLIEVVRDGARARNLALLGSRHEVLFERPSRRGTLLQGRTRQHRTVLVPGGASLIGQYRVVELTGTTGSTFTGAFVGAGRPLPLAG